MDKNSWLQKTRKAEKKNKFELIIELCKDKRVLDVGCIGQDKDLDSEQWLHGRLKKVASELVGVDIDEQGLAAIREKGYTAYTPELLSKEDFKFDLVIMGDVIEHVSDPGQFLSFYAPFLNETGRMVIATPNAFGIRYIIQVLFYGKPGTNEEHTMTFDPYVLLELFQRVNLEPTEFYWLKEYGKGKNLKQRIVLFLSSIFILMRRFFNSNFMFIVRKK